MWTCYTSSVLHRPTHRDGHTGMDTQPSHGQLLLATQYVFVCPRRGRDPDNSQPKADYKLLLHCTEKCFWEGRKYHEISRVTTNFFPTKWTLLFIIITSWTKAELECNTWTQAQFQVAVWAVATHEHRHESRCLSGQSITNFVPHKYWFFIPKHEIFTHENICLYGMSLYHEMG